MQEDVGRILRQYLVAKLAHFIEETALPIRRFEFQGGASRACKFRQSLPLDSSVLGRAPKIIERCVNPVRSNERLSKRLEEARQSSVRRGKFRPIGSLRAQWEDQGL